MSAALVKRLADAGLDAQAIVAALEAFEAVEEERRAAKREGNRERQARKRERENDVSRDVTRDGALQAVTERDAPCPLPSSPQTPQQPTPTPENNTPARKARPAKPSFDPSDPDLVRVWAAATPTSKTRSGMAETASAIQAALEAGATVEAIEASVRENCRIGGDHAKGLHRIINAGLWRGHLAVPLTTAKPPDPQVIAGRQLHFAKTGEWRSEWGPKPSQSQDQAA